ncbi:MAG: hypothetical protein KC420_13730, partial [Myxococcales bacterium]|nr:hypothetical protein [Myxococcales bacterium]
MPELPDPRCRVYESDAEILAGELERLDALLRLRVAQLRRTFVDDPAYHGVVVSDREVDALLDRGVAAPPWASVAIDDELAALADAFADRSELHEARVALTLAGGPPLRLLGLAAGCGLGALDRLVLTLAIAPALDLRYERVIGWLHDDASRRRPSVGLVVDLLAADLGDRLACQAELLGEDAPLLAAGALELLDDPDHPSSPLRRTLRPRPGVIAWL